MGCGSSVRSSVHTAKIHELTLKLERIERDNDDLRRQLGVNAGRRENADTSFIMESAPQDAQVSEANDEIAPSQPEQPPNITSGGWLPGAVADDEQPSHTRVQEHHDLVLEGSMPSVDPTQAAGATACKECGHNGVETFLDPSDQNIYCEGCWASFYHQPPAPLPSALVDVQVVGVWDEKRLVEQWRGSTLPGWPPRAETAEPLRDPGAEIWSSVSLRVRRDIVGPNAREHVANWGPSPGDVLAERYQCEGLIGQGHFTKAFLANDLQSGSLVCLKKHHQLPVETLADLMVVGRRLREVDPEGHVFPRLIDAFYDLFGYTVEGLIEGRNCLAMAATFPGFFTDSQHLHLLAQGCLRGLSLLELAGIVHNDMKPDNLMWVTAESRPLVKIVDFGCARLDMREEPGRNWSLAEGGAGHMGKWSPEMALRLPITHKGDVWGLAISLCELYSGRAVWRNEDDTAEVVLAQSIGLCGLHGVPSSLLSRSQLDILQLYTPPPCHLPVRTNELGELQALAPVNLGLDQVLGEGWRTSPSKLFGEFLESALVIDPEHRPSASQLLSNPFLVEAEGEVCV